MFSKPSTFCITLLFATFATVAAGPNRLPRDLMDGIDETELATNEALAGTEAATNVAVEEGENETLLRDEWNRSLRLEQNRRELETLLDDEQTFVGSFSFLHAYPDAPNPALVVDGLGVIGLPLNPREASVLKVQASQAPFGMADRTVVDPTVRNTWEIDGSEVRFLNQKAWNTFMTTIVESVCNTLGVHYVASKPRAELYKLLLYETGSHFRAHVDTEKQDGMFATIVVVLPSAFTGGAVHVSHSGLSKTLDTSPASATGTTVLAWYTDVTHAVQPVTSGFRLALSYNLVHTTTALRPALPRTLASASALRDVLLTWGAQEGPEKLAYLLGHKYAQAGLRGSALKGADAHKAALLDTLAGELGFRLGLATLVFHERGWPSNSGFRYCGDAPRHWSEPPEDDRDDMDMDMVEETGWTLENVVGLDGRLVEESMEFDPEEEAVDEGLEDIVCGDSWDEQEFEGYLGNGAGSLDRWYRRTVLVIWPDPTAHPVANFQQVAGLSRVDGQPQKKRRKTAYDERDVIDLT